MAASSPLPSRRVLVLVGPTASGKTAVSIRLARMLRGEILSADSRQVYRHLDIGTAKPSVEERGGIPHYFIDELDPGQDFNAGEFGMRGRAVIDAILRRSGVPIVVGGSGLYVRALVDGLFEGPGADWEYREVLQDRVDAGGIGELIEDLRRVDPEAAAKADPTKPRRVIRALEVYHATGKPLSLHHRESVPAADFAAVFFGLEWARKALYARINARCDDMISRGLLEEARSLEAMGYTRRLNALNTVGYKEAFACLHGKLTVPEMTTLIKQHSRQYAKRQLTWFRADTRIRWIRMTEERELGDAASEIAELFNTDE